MTHPNQTGWKKIAGTVGAVALAAAGAYFGIDFTGDSTEAADNGSAGAASATVGASASADATKSRVPTATSSTSATSGNRGGAAQSSQPATSSQSGLAECYVDTLPAEADNVIDRILTDQDHLYSVHDGKHFGNYEGLLPRERGDYYREYTVKTPGEYDRGARRIVVGGGTENDPDVWYYTPDHYETFCEIPDAEE